MMTRTTGITHGTPSSVVSRPRLALQMATSTMPPIAVTTIVRIEMLIGGALRPRRRRRAAVVRVTAAKTARATTSTIQLSVTLMFALTRL